MTVLCVSWFCSPAVTDVRFTHGEFDVVCHALFREERLFVALGYGVVFVAHRKISFVYVFRVRWNVTRPFSPWSAEFDGTDVDGWDGRGRTGRTLTDGTDGTD